MAVNLNSENFKAEVQGPMTIVDFWAPWCGPCKIMDPILDKLEQQFAGKIKFAKVNVDNQQEIAKEYSVYGMPTFVLFKNGKGVEKVTGVYPIEKLTHYLNRKLEEVENSNG